MKCKWFIKCKRSAEYFYYNRVNCEMLYLCREHLDGLRNDVSVNEWVKMGFAKRLSGTEKEVGVLSSRKTSSETHIRLPKCPESKTKGRDK